MCFPATSGVESQWVPAGAKPNCARLILNYQVTQLLQFCGGPEVLIVPLVGRSLLRFLLRLIQHPNAFGPSHRSTRQQLI
jgi:hypothetical protein